MAEAPPAATAVATPKTGSPLAWFATGALVAALAFLAGARVFG
jgi:hypothetical protein